MQLNFTPDQEAFRLEVRDFVKLHLPVDIRRKVEQRLGSLPPIRTAADMRSPGGKRHPFWNPFRMPVRDKAS